MKNPVVLLLSSTLLACGTSSEPSFSSSELRVEETEEAPEEEGRVWLGPTQALEPPRMHEEDSSSVLEFSPADLSTSAEGTFPTILVPFRHLSEEDSSLLAAQFDLVTWPERDVVRTTAVYVDDAMEEGPTHARVVLEPAEPLTDRWYALRARLDRDGGERLQTRSRNDAYVVTDTHAYSRFRFGRQPIVQRVDVTATTDGEAWVTVLFSEPMRLIDEQLPIEVTAEGRVISCATTNREDLQEDGGSLELAAHCEGVRPGSHLSVRFVGESPESVTTTVEDDTLVHRSGGRLIGADEAGGGPEGFELTIPTTAEARLVSPSATDEERAARWYTATARAPFGFEPDELASRFEDRTGR
jgi:hypothetical protein